MLLVRYAIRQLVARKGAGVAAALGVALVTFVLSSSLMLAQGVRRTLAKTGRDDVAMIVRKGSDSELSSIVDEQVRRVVLSTPGIRRDAVTSETVLVLALEKIGAPGRSNVTLRGIDAQSASLRPALRVVAGRAPKLGTNEAMIGARVRGRFRGLELGESLEVRTQRTIVVVGVFEDAGSATESEVWTDDATLRSAFGREGTFSSLRVQLESAAAFDAFASAVEHDKRLGVTVEREPTFLAKQSAGMATFLSAMGTTIALFFSIGAIIGAMITMHAAIAGRTREIGTLRALGFTRRTILMALLIEAVALTAIGGGIGVVLSLAMSFVHVSMVNFATFSELVFTFSPTPGIVVTAFAFGALMGVVGGFFPAVRATRISALDALRQTP